MRSKHFVQQAQAMLEYLLVLIVVVTMVLLAFNNNNASVLKRTQGKANEYFDTGAKAIMGGYYDTTAGKMVRFEPSPINGVWCAWSQDINGYKVRECACPRPAFGGAPCTGEAVSH